MKTKEIKTLEQLAQYINECEEWDITINEVIERNGWIDLTGEQFAVCSDGTNEIMLNEEGIAEVI